MALVSLDIDEQDIWLAVLVGQVVDCDGWHAYGGDRARSVADTSVQVNRDIQVPLAVGDSRRLHPDLSQAVEIPVDLTHPRVVREGLYCNHLPGRADVIGQDQCHHSLVGTHVEYSGSADQPGRPEEIDFAHRLPRVIVPTPG